jgi:aspartate racemase
MKVIDLIGGMSWESSSEYYRLINQETRKQLGGLNSARLPNRSKTPSRFR